MKPKSSVAVACFLPGRAKDLSAPLYLYIPKVEYEHKILMLECWKTAL